MIVRSSTNLWRWAAPLSPPGPSRMSICSARGSKGDCLGVYVLSHTRRHTMADWTVQTLACKRLTRRHLLHGTLASAGLALGQRVLTGFPAVHAAEPMQLHI